MHEMILVRWRVGVLAPLTLVYASPVTGTTAPPVTFDNTLIPGSLVVGVRP
ncbi:MAG: hypothetical protein KatS3mg056_3765 [Chloroflexus sp.]|nr:MAG: hypothetical protein KatS3mg056_3765 [Chloroflexus sp.]